MLLLNFIGSSFYPAVPRKEEKNSQNKDSHCTDLQLNALIKEHFPFINCGPEQAAKKMDVLSGISAK